MPELPEVQTVVNTLRPKAIGRAFTRVVMHRSDIHTPATLDPVKALTGRVISDIVRRAKRIVFTLDDGSRFYVHLGMTGQLTVEDASLPAKPHTHMVLTLAKTGDTPAQELRFRDPRRFGGIFFLPDDHSDAHIGPEPLTLSPSRLMKRLEKTKRPIKAALLDQRVIAGLGNIYVDESLHQAGIHPLKLASELTPTEVARLNRAIKSTLRRAIRLGGSSISDYVDANGSSGRAQTRHAVYARQGKPCPTCKTPIERIVLTGRSTHFCPHCQPPG
jgi:formamidopyrimidine-DNA glycosylase